MMFTKTNSIKWVAVVVLLITVVFAGLALAAGDNSQTNASVETLKFDVSEDMNRFAFDQTKTFDDGLPAHGSSFVTEGYIYEYGTLNGSDGVLADGSPEFSDKVIGTWICKGWFVGDAAHATEGVWVVSTQIYNFGEEYGNTMLITEGYESAATGETIARAITGGTGQYTGADGVANQVLLGFNEGTEGVNLRFEVAFAK